MNRMVSGAVSASSVIGAGTLPPFLFDAENRTGDFVLDDVIVSGVVLPEEPDRTEDSLSRRTTSRPTSDLWTTRFVHQDGLGSVRAITDESGNVVDTRGYEAFGTKSVEAGSETLPYGFAGEPLDSTTHLAYHRARWMDSRMGRFVGMDPLLGSPRLPKSLHRYFYANLNPVSVTDPSGLEGDVGDVAADVIDIGIEASAEDTPIVHALEVTSEARVDTAVTEINSVLQLSDLGLAEGAPFEVSGSVLQSGATKIITVDLIEANETVSVFQRLAQLRPALQTMLNAARANGISTLQIQASFANDTLAAAVQTWVTQAGGTFASSGGAETITFLIAP